MLQRRATLSNSVLVLTVLLVFPVGQTFGESVMVKRKYVPGRVSYIENQTEIDQEISGMPMPPMKFHIEQLFGLWEKIESATNEKAGIKLTFDRAVRNVEAPMMGNVEFDTDDPEDEEAAPQLGTILNPMIGMAMTMEVGKDAEVISFSGMDAINKKISERAIASMHWEQMKEEFTDEYGKETWAREPLLIYPNKKVKVGDTWKASSSIDRGPFGTIVTDYQYKVERIGVENGRKVVVISVTGTVSAGADEQDKSEPKEPGSAEQDKGEGDVKKAEPKMEIDGKLAGTAVYDVALGRIVKRTGGGKVNVRIPLTKLIPNMPAGDEPQFAVFDATIKNTMLILNEKERNTQKAEARKKAELRRKAEEEEDEDDDEDEEDDD